MKMSPCFARSYLLSKRGGCALVVASVALVCMWQSGPASAQPPLMNANEPPGALGFKRRIAGGDVGDGFFQPVRIVVPQGARVSPADSPTERNHPTQPVFGLNVGRPYRFVISNIPLMEELPLYPSIELIDRTYPPPGTEVRFAIPIEFSTEDLRAAAAGNYIERIVYVEDPDLALPVGTNRDSMQRVFDVDDDEDPLAIAHTLGRPVAVVRLGSKAPDSEVPDDVFLFGSPPLQYFDAQPEQVDSAAAEVESEAELESEPSSIEHETLLGAPSVRGRSESPIDNNSRPRRIPR